MNKYKTIKIAKMTAATVTMVQAKRVIEADHDFITRPIPFECL